MNCSDCEKLFDAFLDGQLGGSLRLEFDAHRLRCRRCQQTVAMLETIGNVIANDPVVPELRADFSDRVVARIRAPRRTRRPIMRIALVSGAVLQAAAVLLFAIYLTAQPRSGPVATPAGLTAPVADADVQGIKDLVLERLEDRIWSMHRAGSDLTSEVRSMAQYLNIIVPDDVAESARALEVNPFQAFWDALLPGAAVEPDAAGPTDDIHSI